MHVLFGCRSFSHDKPQCTFQTHLQITQLNKCIHNATKGSSIQDKNEVGFPRIFISRNWVIYGFEEIFVFSTHF